MTEILKDILKDVPKKKLMKNCYTQKASKERVG